MNKRYPERHQFVNPDSAIDMLGGGFGYPIVVNKTGGVELQTGSTHTGSEIKHFSNYDYTDLVGTPLFGGGIPSTLWKLITSNLIGIKQTQMEDGLEYWMPHVEDVQVLVGKTVGNPNGLTVKVMFKEKVTGDIEYLMYNSPMDERN